MSESARRPGRPRSEAARQAILSAAYAEMAEQGFGGLTMERIAARAGVGKQTIYRWWPSKADVVLDALLEIAAEIPLPDEGSLQADLVTFLTDTFRLLDRARPMLVGLMAQSLLDPAFAEGFRARFIARRRAVLRSLLERAALRGELAAGEDLDLLVDMAYGVLWYRLLVQHAPLDDGTARDIASVLTRTAGGG